TCDALLSLFYTSATKLIFTPSLHDALPIFPGISAFFPPHASCRTFSSISLSKRNRTQISGSFLPAPIKRSWTDPRFWPIIPIRRSEEHTSELQSRFDLVCRLLLEKKN